MSETEKLENKKCVPCEGGIPALTQSEAEGFMGRLESWTMEDGKKIHRNFKFKDFPEALSFVNRVGAVAEAEGHHPDIFLYQWNQVRVDLWTHSVSGLTENDFIVAAKVDREVQAL